jgi:CheY-like chemotaxis protein
MKIKQDTDTAHRIARAPTFGVESTAGQNPSGKPFALLELLGQTSPGSPPRRERTPTSPIDPIDPSAANEPLGLRRDAYRVLVVDDNVDACEGTELAFDGPLAIAKAERFRPHVVLLDIAMPRMSGYEVARRLRENPLTRDALLIALTGLGAADDIARAWQAGFDDYRLKPVDIDELLELLSARLDRRRGPQS